MIKVKYKRLESVGSLSGFFIVLEEDGLQSEETARVGNELLEKGDASTDEAIYRIVGKVLYVARENGVIEVRRGTFK